MEHCYCNNCGKIGHMYNQCKIPIISIGVIAFRFHENQIQYLMIRRKETLGFIDFMRGKYSITNDEYILNMMKQMTTTEKDKLTKGNFDEIWKEIWCDMESSMQYKSEKVSSQDKFNILRDGVNVKGRQFSLESLLEESKRFTEWSNPEWGFPKGRRNPYEKDYDCAVREFTEETGYNKDHLKNIQNIMPIYEILTGSNYKSYKHKYFMMLMDYEDTTSVFDFQKSEVSKMEWFNMQDCINEIRPYNLEKIKMITNVDRCLSEMTICSM